MVDHGALQQLVLKSEMIYRFNGVQTYNGTAWVGEFFELCSINGIEHQYATLAHF
jgi:hypothetical protein